MELQSWMHLSSHSFSFLSQSSLIEILYFFESQLAECNLSPNDLLDGAIRKVSGCFLLSVQT